MIIGNPHYFAIIVNKIDEWNVNDDFCNGVLLFCVNGDLFPQKVAVATLKCEIRAINEKLKKPVINKTLYDMQKDKAFEEIYNLVFPEDTDINNDYRFVLSPESFTDEHCYVFIISNGTHVRIMAAELNYNIEASRHNIKNISISETFVDIDELNVMISKIGIN